MLRGVQGWRFEGRGIGRQMHPVLQKIISQGVAAEVEVVSTDEAAEAEAKDVGMLEQFRSAVAKGRTDVDELDDKVAMFPAAAEA